ncbi:MAG TPA: fructose-bisphosphatase class III [Pyrinomonadaceae bacterium]|nr:fructose-bisphosphatase class III [Pyrinomonadaceae bacterium]
MAVSFDIEELTMLRELARHYPTAGAALVESAVLRAALQLPKETVHVFSDVHGEFKKLRHVINNASGSLRPLVSSIFEGKVSEDEQRELVAVLYYPRETMEHLRPLLSDPSFRRAWVRRTLRRQFELVRGLARNYRHERVRELFPSEAQEICEELFSEPSTGRGEGYVDAMLDALAEHGRDLSAVRLTSRLVRNLAVSELVIAGDLGDRGPNIDKVIDYLMRQPKVSFAWGNHDVLWMGACLGQEALIATVLRVSLRYRRLFQLEEGYGITLAPLEWLAREAYADDPAERFMPKRGGRRDDLLVARMQKAAAVMQFKLEAQTAARHPEWGMEGRNLLHRVDRERGTVEIDGEPYALRDSFFPTVDPSNPYELSPDERECMDRMRESFTSSARLWQHMSYVARHGSMWLRRDHAVIFHGCVPVDERGRPLALEVSGGAEVSGRALFDAFDSLVRRAFRKGASRAGADADGLWYLWTGPRSPLFGKDRMSTFEQYFVEDKRAHKEHKNPYFDFVHDAEFCRRVAAEFGVGSDGLLVNGHVPVKVEKGEEPVKTGGGAVTIDGAFSESYGDRGYTLILGPDGVFIAELHNFQSISDAITRGADIVPRVETVRAYTRPRRVCDTEQGELIRHRIKALERLILAYEEGALLEAGR